MRAASCKALRNECLTNKRSLISELIVKWSCGALPLMATEGGLLGFPAEDPTRERDVPPPGFARERRRVSRRGQRAGGRELCQTL